MADIFEGAFDSKQLENYAICGARMILANERMSKVFEENPDGCYRGLMVTYLFNDNFIQPLVDAHPSFFPVAESFRQAVRAGGSPGDICAELFSECLKLYETETYQHDVNFNIMLAAIFYIYYSEDEHTTYGNMFFPLIAQCGDVRGIIPITLLACALWGADYENFRELATKKYYEWKARKENGGETQQEVSENQSNDLLEAARKNVDHYDEKLHFISDINERATKNIQSLDSQVELGKKYVRYYMEIERYYIDPLDRLRFIAFCADALPETLLKNGGFVPLDYFTDQFEKGIHSLNSTDQRIAFIRQIAKRAKSVADWEMIRSIAHGDCDNMENFGWVRVCEYIYNKSEEWGWDRCLEDAEQWDYIPHDQRVAQAQAQEAQQSASAPQTPVSNSSDNYSSSSGGKSGGCYIATAVYGSYDCPEVWTLRRFRDYSLAQNQYGRVFIKAYYAVSPTLVRWFGQTAWFSRLWCGLLDKLVLWLKSKGYDDSPYHD